MITIITGSPGAGKTSEMVALIMGLVKDGQRPIYAANINDLKLPHTAIDPLKWHEEAPVGAVIAIDEGQEFFRPTGPGQKVPECIQRMEVHRHTGNDFIITTQGPHLLHKNIKELAGRHIHIRDLGFLGRWWYEWPEVCDNPKSQWKTAPFKKKHRLDKKTFEAYKSSSMHVKPVRSFPLAVFILGAALLAAGVASYYGYKSISGKIAPPPSTAKPGPVAGSPGASVPVSGQTPSTALPAYLTDPSQFTPRFSRSPESAPAYDHLRKVVAMPVVVGGYCQGPKCFCVNQQGRPSGLSHDDCKAWLDSPPFDPYREPSRISEPATRSTGDKTPSS